MGETNFHTKDGEKKKKRKEERLNDGENNCQATLGARKHAWRTQAAWATPSILNCSFDICLRVHQSESGKVKKNVQSLEQA